jgi:hypothetical protein
LAEIQNPRSTNCNTAEIPTVRNKKILIAQNKIRGILRRIQRAASRADQEQLKNRLMVFDQQ